MSETPRGNHNSWQWKWRKRKQSKKNRPYHSNEQQREDPHGSQASNHHDDVGTQGSRRDQGLDRSHRVEHRVSDLRIARTLSADIDVRTARVQHCFTTATSARSVHPPKHHQRSLGCEKSSKVYRTACACSSHQGTARNGTIHQTTGDSSWTGQGASTSEQSSSTKTTLVKEIPGFYYDPDKKRYFRLLAGHNNFNPLTRESLEKKDAEKRRQEMIEGNLPACRQQGTELKNSLSLCSLQRRLQTGQLTSRQFTRYAQEQVVSNLNLRPSKLNNFPDSYFDGDSGDISFLQVDRSQQKILMVLSHDYLSRIWQGTITCDPSKPRALTVTNWKVNNIIGTRSAKITSASWVSTDGTEDLQVIYTLCGGPMNLVHLLKCPAEEDGHSHTTYSYESDHELTWTCAYSNNPLTPGYLSIGSNKKAIVVDTVSAEKWKVFTNHSDVLAQVFATRSPVLYNGTRRGEILGCDLRSLTETRSDINLRLRQKVTVCSVRLLKDENYLLASDMSGQIRLWDLRQCLCVQEYHGHYNRHSYLPICLDSTETILYGAGQDRYTRLWSLQGGRLLRTVPCPLPPSPLSPAVVYSREWHNGAPPGLLLGVQRDLYWYPI